MPRKPSRKTLKQKAWKAFSEYIRRRDADENGYVKCCTCSEVKHWRSGDAGHFISRSYLATLFEETNVAFQCKKCNGFRSGSPDEYAKFIIETYGQEEFERLRLKKYETVKFSDQDYIDIAEKYKKKCEEL